MTSSYYRGRMIKQILCLVLLSLWSVLLIGQIPLPELTKPWKLVVLDHKLYVGEKATVWVYDLNKGEMIHQFGQEGEGPADFKQAIYFMFNYEGKLVINSLARISEFNSGGELLRVKDLHNNGWLFKPLGERYIGFQTDTDPKGITYNSLNLYDEELNRTLNIFKKASPNQPNVNKQLVFFTQGGVYDIGDGKIFINSREDFIIDVYDTHAKKVNTIEVPDYPCVKVTAETKEKVRKNIKRIKYYRDWISTHGGKIVFTDNYPAILYLHVSQKVLYVMTMKKGPGGQEFYIFSTTGELLSHQYIPVLDEEEEMKPFTIDGEKLYLLKENPHSDLWELHVTDIPFRKNSPIGK